MKNNASKLAAIAAAGMLAGVAQAANPLLPKLYTADPAALVDNGMVYLYVGHDSAEPAGKDYVMKEWRLYSSCDMKNWTDRGSPIQPSAFKWAIGKVDAWAADITKRDGKYYFYATVDHASIPGRAIGVAVSDKPEGPFVDARGSALVSNDMTLEAPIAWDDIDPGVFTDDNGQAYLYWGNTVLKYAKLKANMTEFDGPIVTVGMDRFTEAPYLHKHNGTYYLSYSRDFPEETAYMTGPSPTGPWHYRGVIMAKNAKVKTIHQAIIDFNGKSYIFYHNAKLPGGGEFRRSVAVEEFAYNADGTIPFIKQTREGPAANPGPACK
ncbi:family 43 glycosylhydrolase [Duganella sp. SAP-35]|uniref:Family 43 glycosylhydrolase n=2 Tax=Duganella aceris TaxID=2703883 RepID=A0ABX0FRH3_9BURK|nr:glycoside hydrolase family 43 protein [Duganella aceris]NGZ87246.1 family 43 glycosylhydrolase [Duganella aceris]